MVISIFYLIIFFVANGFCLFSSNLRRELFTRRLLTTSIFLVVLGVYFTFCVLYIMFQYDSVKFVWF